MSRTSKCPPSFLDPLAVRCPVAYCLAEQGRKCCDRNGECRSDEHRARKSLAKQLTPKAATRDKSRWYVRTPSGFVYRPSGNTPEEAWRLFLTSWRGETRESMESKGYDLLRILRERRSNHARRW